MTKSLRFNYVRIDRASVRFEELPNFFRLCCVYCIAVQHRSHVIDIADGSGYGEISGSGSRDQESRYRSIARPLVSCVAEAAGVSLEFIVATQWLRTPGAESGYGRENTHRGSRRAAA
jgi:hypothetical protein